MLATFHNQPRLGGMGKSQECECVKVREERFIQEGKDSAMQFSEYSIVGSHSWNPLLCPVRNESLNNFVQVITLYPQSHHDLMWDES